MNRVTREMYEEKVRTIQLALLDAGSLIFKVDYDPEDTPVDTDLITVEDADDCLSELADAWKVLQTGTVDNEYTRPDGFVDALLAIQENPLLDAGQIVALS